MAFQREFQLRRDRVEERNPQEEYKLMMRNLSQDWQRRILEEESKRGKRKFLVRMTGFDEKEPRVFKHHLENLIHGEVLQVKLIQNGAMVHCGDAAVQNKVISLAGHLYDDKAIKCSRVDPTLSGDDMAEFIRQKLETTHKLQTLRQTWDDVPKATSTNAVEGAETNFVSHEKPRDTPAPKQPYTTHQDAKGGEVHWKGTEPVGETCQPKNASPRGVLWLLP